MSTLFTRIIDGELPGRFVWSDDRAVGFLSINPLGPGHTLVVPRAEVDHWVDAEPDLLAHLTSVAHAVGKAVRDVWQPPRVGVIVAGFEVPHLHLHVFPAWNMAAFDFANAAPSVEAQEQEGQAEKLRAALRAAGHGDSVPLLTPPAAGAEPPHVRRAAPVRVTAVRAPVRAGRVPRRADGRLAVWSAEPPGYPSTGTRPEPDRATRAHARLTVDARLLLSVTIRAQFPRPGGGAGDGAEALLRQPGDTGQHASGLTRTAHDLLR